MLRSLTITALALTALSLPVHAETASPAANDQQAAVRQSTMIVLDGSNSMWGQLEGINKIVTARESLRTLLENAHGSIDFGLLTYGDTRKKNGCTDFTLRSKPQDYDMVNLLKDIYRIKPLGRSPIADALKMAASTLPANNAHILLVSDGEESCGGDPCAVAKELVAANPALQIDVIGFREEKEAQLECIAENGRGAFVYARDTQRLKTLLAGVQAQAQVIQQEAGISPAVPVDPTALPGSVELDINSAGAEGDLLRANYSIYTPSGENIANFTARSHVKEYLQPGTYRIKAIWQNRVEEDTVTIQAGKASKLNFNVGPSGLLEASALDKNGQPLPVNYSIYNRNGDFISRYIMQDGVKTRLPVGDYRIKAALEDNAQEAEIKIEQGSQTRQQFQFRN